MLKPVTILLGIFIMITRGYGFLFPTKMKSIATELAHDSTLVRIVGSILFVLSLLIFAAVGGEIFGPRIVMLLVAISILSGAILMAFFPGKYKLLVDWFMALPESTVRMLYGIGFAFGLFLAIMAIYAY